MSFEKITVPFVDLAIAKNSRHHKEILSVISSVLETGNFICGEQVELFEKSLATYCGCKYAIGVNSGTDALFFALKCQGVTSGDEVIIPANVFWAVANSVMNCGATPIFADVDSSDMLLSKKTIEAKITKKTKAIICVHLTGMVCKMDPINKLAERHNIAVIEDAAQALGAEYKGRKAGGLAKVGCFSFHPLKNIGGIGDGGALVTNDETIFRRCMQYRNHGLNEKSSQERVGFNSRLDEIQAAVLSYRLAGIEDIITHKRSIARKYKRRLPKECKVVEEGNDRKGVYQLFMVQCEKRDELRAYLLANGIGTGVHYARYQYNQKPYRIFDSTHLEVTASLEKSIISLPIHTSMTDSDAERICSLITSFYK